MKISKLLPQSYCFIVFSTLSLLVSCASNGSSDALITGSVTEVDSYGGLVPSFSSSQLEAAGVAYGDMLEVTIGDSLTVTMPYVDAYTEAGSMSPCLCNYNKNNEDFTFSMSNGSFAGHVGGKAGDTIIVRMKQKEGYLNEYNLLQGTYTAERADYSSDEVFANFREMTTTGLKPQTLYRGTSPISFKKNKIRYSYTATLCQKAGVQTVLDIADSDEKIQEFLTADESKDSYMLELQGKGNIIGLGSNADYIDTVFMRKLADGLRKMITKPAPYIIHCNEGKDRTGFYCLLLEALCGATADEIKEDYMKTFENLYKQEKGSEQYELTWRKNGFRMLYMLGKPETWKDVVSVDWDNASIEGANLSKAAETYLLTAGLTQDEVTALRNLLGKKD